MSSIASMALLPTMLLPNPLTIGSCSEGIHPIFSNTYAWRSKISDREETWEEALQRLTNSTENYIRKWNV